MRQGAERPSGRSGFFADRWHGAAPLERLFWTDMLIVATLINVAAALGAVVLLGLKLPGWLAVAAFLAPLPYNVFLVLAVWRATEQSPANTASAYRAGALIWLALALVL